MQKTFFVLVVFASVFLIDSNVASSSTILSTVAATVLATPTLHVVVPQAPSAPVRLAIPSIKLDDPVQSVGLTKEGAMDVPDGRTKNVGWYQAGTVPGNAGSAVMDAHVFAAFSKLKNVKVGDMLYVTTATGQIQKFVVTKAQTYALADVPLQELFNKRDGAHLNLITCAGKLTADKSTYDHRLVVYATLVA